MQGNKKSHEIVEAATKYRQPWTAPAVSRMRAGMAEVGFTNSIDDGPGTKS